VPCLKGNIGLGSGLVAAGGAREAATEAVGGVVIRTGWRTARVRRETTHRVAGAVDRRAVTRGQAQDGLGGKNQPFHQNSHLLSGGGSGFDKQ
jgi:hypothetical protein